MRGVKDCVLTVMKYSFVHVCKGKRQLFFMEVEKGEEPAEVMEEEAMVDTAELLSMMGQNFETDQEGAILPHISVRAMNGIHDFRTMRVTVKKGNSGFDRYGKYTQLPQPRDN